jgi:hypothetical protein
LGLGGRVKQRKREAGAFTAGRLEPTMPPPRASSGPCLRAKRGYKGQNSLESRGVSANRPPRLFAVMNRVRSPATRIDTAASASADARSPGWTAHRGVIEFTHPTGSRATLRVSLLLWRSDRRAVSRDEPSRLRRACPLPTGDGDRRDLAERRCSHHSWRVRESERPTPARDEHPQLTAN